MNYNKITKQCFNCNHVIKSTKIPIQFDKCKHSLCYTCLMRKTLTSNLCNFSKTNEMIIKCKCKTDYYCLDINSLNNIIKSIYSERKENECSRHFKEKNYLCQTCNKFYCEICINEHHQFFQEHLIINSDETIDDYYCQCRRRTADIYCKNCKKILCINCFNHNMDTHLNHSTISLEYMRNVIQFKFKKNKYQTFLLFKEKIEQIKDNYQKDIIQYLNKINSLFQEISLMIERAKHNLENKIKEEKDKINQMVMYIQDIYQMFYNDYNDFINNNKEFSIYKLKYMQKVNYEFSDILFTINKFDFSTIEKEIEKMKNYPFLKYSFDFKQKLFTLLQKVNNSSDCFSLLELSNGKIASGLLKEISIHNPKNNFEIEKKFPIQNGIIFSLCEIKSPPNIIATIDSTENIIKFWDTTTQKIIRIFENDSYDTSPPKYLCSMIPIDNKSKLVCGTEKNLIIWDIITSKKICELYGHSKSVCSLLEYSKNIIISGSGEGLIKFWDWVNEKEIKTLKGHEGTVSSMTIYGNNNLASGGYDCTLRIWDIEKMKCKKIIKGHQHKIMSLLSLPNGMIASGTYRKIIIWNTLDFSCFQILDGFKGFVNSLIVLKDGRIVSGANEILIWI